MEGVVRWYSHQGYGFIDPLQPIDGGGAVYFHITAVKGGLILKTGDPVTFDVIEARKGPRATNVSRANTKEVNHVHESRLV